MANGQPLYMLPVPNPRTNRPDVAPPTLPGVAPDVTGSTIQPGGISSPAVNPGGQFSPGWASPPPTPSVTLPGALPGVQAPPDQTNPLMPQAPIMPQGGPPTPPQDQSLGGPGIPPAYNSFPSVRGGPVKNALTRMLYGMGQAGLAHVGLPTDYQIQQNQYEQALKAGQLRVQQAHEQLLQQAQQYQQSTRTVYTPWGPVQMGPRDASEYERQQVLSQQQAQQAQDLKAFQPNPTIPQQWGTAMADYLAKNPGGDWTKDQSPEAIKVQQLQKAVQMSGKMTDEQRDTAATILANGGDINDPKWQVWARNDNILAKQPGYSGYTTQRVVDRSGNVSTIQVPSGRAPAFRPPPPSVTPSAAAAAAASPPAGPAAQPGVPSAAQSRIPPNTPASKAMGRGIVAQPILDAQGQPFQGPNAGKAFTWTENGQQVLGNGQQLAQAKAQDPSVQAINAPQADVSKANSARRWVADLADIPGSDPRNNPEGAGIKQLIDDLAAQGKLGTIASRWNDFMAGKIGAGDPEYAALRTKMGLSNTLLMNVHVGNRGGSYMLEHFQDLANAGKMDADTLKSSYNSELDYARRAQMLPGAGRTTPPPANRRPLGDFERK